MLTYTVVSDSLRLHGPDPTRLLCPWYPSGKNIEVVALHPLKHLPNPGIEPMFPALAGRFFTTELPGKPAGVLS